jgi:3-oxoacyl-[acyl-carrier-protein] synthase-3
MKILATGSAVPERVVTNDDLAAFLDTSDQWIRTRTGICQRRVADRPLEFLAAQAAQNALEASGLQAGQLDLILCSNVLSRYVAPGLGCIVAGLIGAQCPCLDINGACAGFLYALELAQAQLQTGRYQRVLIVCAEEPSSAVDWTDRATCVLFGDAAAAAIVTGDGEPARFLMRAQANREVLYALRDAGNCPYEKENPQAQPLWMNGQEVYKFAVHAAAQDIRALCQGQKIVPEAVNWFLLHQANARILEAVRMRLAQPQEKFPSNIDRYGNTSSAGLPLLIDELNRAGTLRRGDLVAMSAFGAGLTTGACLMRW